MPKLRRRRTPLALGVAAMPALPAVVAALTGDKLVSRLR
jgi:hypothetical protein